MRHDFSENLIGFRLIHPFYGNSFLCIFTLIGIDGYVKKKFSSTYFLQSAHFVKTFSACKNVKMRIFFDFEPLLGYAVEHVKGPPIASALTL